MKKKKLPQKSLSMKRIKILTLRWLVRNDKVDEKEKKIVKELFDYLDKHKYDKLNFFENV